MSKPWEETWHAVIGGHTGGCGGWRNGKWTFSTGADKPGWCTDGQQPGYGIPEEVARLAAAAPDLARALLELEWTGPEAHRQCPSCGASDVRGHYDECTLAAALRKAGVIE